MEIYPRFVPQIWIAFWSAIVHGCVHICLWILYVCTILLNRTMLGSINVTCPGSFWWVHNIPVPLSGQLVAPLDGRRVSWGVGCLLMFMSIKILYIHSQWLPWHWMSKMILLFCLFGCDSLWMENKVKEMKSCFFQEYNLQSCVELVSFHHATKFTNETGVWQCCILM